MRTEKMLEKICRIHLCEGYKIEKYSDSNRLYKNIEEGKLADIYFLDVLMPIKSGIDIGNQIRSKDSMVLENGRAVPVSKNKYTQVKREYLLFMVNRYK